METSTRYTSMPYTGFVAVTLLLGMFFLPAKSARAQGCIVARSTGASLGPEGEGGFLAPGDWETTISYRHQYSFKHFIGPTEQVQRVQQGNEVMNKINLENLDVTYQATERISVEANLPVLFASRRSNNAFATLHTSGIGDMSVVGQAWLWNPKRVHSGNIEIGLGLQMPTGKDRVQNSVLLTASAASPVLSTPDYSVQPGQGSWGMVMQWQAFKQVVGGTTVYTDGNYLMTQGGNNGVIGSHGGASATATVATSPNSYNAIQDQYFIEVAAAHAAPKLHGLTMTLGVRDEGVPARDLIGDDTGFRRPGFAISLAPGFIYNRGNSMLQASVGVAMYRDRTLSVPDMENGTHGDAAFADYVWEMSYSLHLPKHSSEH